MTPRPMPEVNAATCDAETLRDLHAAYERRKTQSYKQDRADLRARILDDAKAAAGPAWELTDLTPEWCVAEYYRGARKYLVRKGLVNPGSRAFPHIPSLYLLDFARAVAARVRGGGVDPEFRHQYEVQKARAERAEADAKRDAAIIDTLEFMARERGGILLHDGTESGRRGFGLMSRSLREAVSIHVQKPAPEPPRVVLSDGSVVTWDAAQARFDRANGTRFGTIWRELLDDSDTGADFDALKRFAEQVGAP